MAPSEKRVLLIDPPLRMPNFTVLGPALLKAILARAGYPADMLSATLFFPKSDDQDPIHTQIRTHFAQFLFVPVLFPSMPLRDCIQAVRDSALEQFGLRGALFPGEAMTLRHIGLDEESLCRAILASVQHSQACVASCVERADAACYDIVGFSCTFETQIPGALAIATRLRTRRPEVTILFGGAACFGEPADELMRAFPLIDVVCHSEGDQVILPLVQALRAAVGPQGRAARDLLLRAVPGIIWRDAAGRLVRNPAPPLLHNLDSLPIPDYDDFMQQLAESDYASCAPHLYFETSRGCWWGEKHLCSFCGLNAEGLPFRRKSPERAFDEILALHQRYPTAERLCATDNILEMGYLKSLMPRLAAWRRTQRRPLRLFFEVKSNLRREHVRLLAQAGVDHVQPGIESFSDEQLAQMDKGATGLGQVQTIKWLYEEGIGAAYHLLVLNPQETAQQYRELSELVPFLEHLPPPKLASMELHRFSPYHLEPQHHGIRNVRARSYYAFAYPVPGIHLDRLAYRFDYDHDMFQDEELARARRAFLDRVRAWSTRWQPEMAYYLEGDGWLVIVDGRVPFPRSHRLSGLAVEVFRHLDQVRPRSGLRQRFVHVAPEVLDAALDVWRHRRWICRDARDRHLAVIPRRRERAAGHRPGLPISPVGAEEQQAGPAEVYGA